MEHALRENPHDFQSQLALARSYGGSGQIAEALSLVQQLASDHACSVEVWETWLWCLYESGNFGNSYLRYHSNDPDAVLVMTRVCGAEESKRWIEQCVQEKPEDLQAWADLLWIALEQHELEDAQGVVERLPSAAHASAKLWHLRGRLCSDQNRLEESVASLNEAVQTNPYQSK